MSEATEKSAMGSLNANVLFQYRKVFVSSVVSTDGTRSYWGTFFKPLIVSAGGLMLVGAIGLAGWAVWITGSVLVGLNVLISWGIAAGFVMYLPDMIERALAAFRFTWDLTKGRDRMEEVLENIREVEVK